MTARLRTLLVAVVLLCGAVGVMATTQTWLEVTLHGVAAKPLTVAGSAAVSVATPLSLAVLALGAVLAITGTIMRHVLGALAVIIAAVQGYLTAHVAFATPTSAVASTVTKSTGITGAQPVADLVAHITPTAWPFVALAAWIVLAAAGVAVLVTARRWPSSGRKYRMASGHRAAAGPLNAVDSWDGLSRGEDPTADGDPR